MPFFQSKQQLAPQPQGQSEQSIQRQGQITAPNDIGRDVMELSRKSRISEERVLSLRKKLQMIEHNMLANQKRLLAEIKYINEEVMEIKRSMEDFKGKMLTFARELQESAKREDLAVLEKYINLWDPMNFISRREVDRIIDEKLAARKSSEKL